MVTETCSFRKQWNKTATITEFIDGNPVFKCVRIKEFWKKTYHVFAETHPTGLKTFFFVVQTGLFASYPNLFLRIAITFTSYIITGFTDAHTDLSLRCSTQ